jgi:hypothetical protein
MKVAVGAALYQEGEEIIAKAKIITPKDTGALYNSGHVNLPVDNGRGLEVTIGFGGPAGTGNTGGTQENDVGYAVPVHENLTARHNPGTSAKFLEIPFNEAKKDMGERLAARIKNNLSGG